MRQQIHVPIAQTTFLRWALALQEYKFTMIYHRGASNIVVDALSPMEYHATQWTQDVIDLPLQPQKIAQMQQQDSMIKDLML